MPEKERIELISRNNLLRVIYRNERMCPNTFLDVFLIGVKNRNCLEPTLENYCTGMKYSPNIPDFSFSGSPTPGTPTNELFLLFKYVQGTRITQAQRDIVCSFIFSNKNVPTFSQIISKLASFQLEVLNFAVNGTATTNDYAKVEKILNDIDPINRLEEDYTRLHEELATFQTPQQANYTMSFYRSLTRNVKTSQIAAVRSRCILDFFCFEF